MADVSGVEAVVVEVVRLLGQEVVDVVGAVEDLDDVVRGLRGSHIERVVGVGWEEPDGRRTTGDDGRDELAGRPVQVPAIDRIVVFCRLVVKPVGAGRNVGKRDVHLAVNRPDLPLLPVVVVAALPDALKLPTTGGVGLADLLLN